MTTYDYEKGYKQKLKEKKLKDITSISIEILDMLIKYGFVHDPFNTDETTKFFIQDEINDILIKKLIK